MCRQHILEKYKITSEELENSIKAIVKNIAGISDSRVMMAVSDLLTNGDIRIPELEVKGNDEGFLIGDVVEIVCYSPDCHLSQKGIYIGVVVDHPEVGLSVALHDLDLTAKNEKGVRYPQFFQACGWMNHEIKLLYRENRNRSQDGNPSYYCSDSIYYPDGMSREELQLELLDYLLDVDPNYSELEALREWIEDENDFNTNGWLSYDEHGNEMDFIEAERANKERIAEKVAEDTIIQMVQEEFNKIKANEDLTTYQKNVQYASLMTVLERQFNIPMFDELDRRLPGHVLYREISDERVMEEVETSKNNESN